MYTFTRRFLDRSIVSTSELVPDVFELPKWRAYLCALTIAEVGGLTCYVYKLVGPDRWRRVRTFWGDWHMTCHYESRRFTKAGNDGWKWRGVVYHYSNIDGEEVIDYESHNYDTSHEAIDDAEGWMEENNIDGEMS